MAKPRNRGDVGLALGYKSGLEEVIGKQLAGMGIVVEYESVTIPFLQPPKPRKYTPDWPLPNGIIVESKGRFVTADRQKHLLVKEQHPDIDVRFVFSNPNTRISKQSATTYAAWCQHKGFQYAKGLVPVAWVKEPINERSIAALKLLRKEKKA